MKLPFTTITILCVTLSSCDKAKDLAEKAKSAVLSKISNRSGESLDSKPDPELQKLVEKSAAGTIFRKDLPFPNRVTVKITQKREVSGRFSQKSELGSQVDLLKGTFSTVSQLERAGDRVTYTLAESIFTEPVLEDADAKKEPVAKVLEPPSAPFEFVKSGSSWKSAVATDFRTVSRAQTIAPFFDQLLVENTLASRAIWLAKKPHNIGDEFAITDKNLSMVITGNAKGQLKLKLEAFEAVHGHPCGVFSVTGDFTRKQFPNFSGVMTNEDVTIESGRLWFSLLYPLILKEDLAVIRTENAGGQGGLATSGRSWAKVSVVREWKGGSVK